AKQDTPQNGQQVLKFFDWALKSGQKFATELDYVPLPPATVSLIQAEWKKITDSSGKAVF
ncbi:MAG: phosphate ABC transporter substrate-binding protein PstS, partial [Burkholderiales bacterium]